MNESKATEMPPVEKPPVDKEMTAGQRYVADYLPECKEGAVHNWIAESIDSGLIVACPRCHFLHLPRRPFPYSGAGDRKHGIAEPVDNCDVCAALPEACRLPMDYEHFQFALDNAASDVEEERGVRAQTLMDLFHSATNGADALVLSKLAEARDTLTALARTPV